MVKETPSKATDDGDGVGNGPSRPIRKSAAKAHLAWEAEKNKRNKSESGPKNKSEAKVNKAAADSGPRKTRPKPTYDAASIPDTSEEEGAPPSIVKVGPPKNAKRVKKADKEPEPEDMDEEQAISSQRRVQRQRAAVGSPARVGSSCGGARDDDIDELEGFKEGKSDDELDNEPGDDDEEEEEEEPEDDLAKLVNNPRALLEKLDAEEAQWAEDDAEDADAIDGLMSDDPPRTHSGRRRSSTSQPASSRAQERTSAAFTPSISKKRRTAVISADEGSNSEEASHPPPKKRLIATSVGGLAAKDKGKAKENAIHKPREQQKQEEREEQRRAERERQKREERRKEREHQLRELERLRRHLEQEDEEERARPESQPRAGNKRTTRETGSAKEKEQARGQNREREQAKSKGASGTSKAGASGGKKRSKPDEDIAWADEKGDQPSSSKRAAKRKRDAEASADGSELSEANVDSELDSAEGNIAAVIHKEGRIRLTDQHGRVQRVCTTAIKELLTNICIKNAYPDGAEKSSDFAKAALITAAKTLKYNDIMKKLRADTDYAGKLASIPAQRVYNLRGKAKKAADPLVSTVFNLEAGDADKVRWLHDGLRFIYPHNYENNTVDGEKAYSQPIFYQILRSAFFNKPRSFGFSIMERFESSHPEKPDEKEIPSALLALAATAVFASIEDYRTSRSEAGDFKSNLFIEAYRSNMDVLSEIKSDNIGAYHRLMHGLYSKLMGVSATSVRQGARSFLNTKDMAQ